MQDLTYKHTILMEGKESTMDTSKLKRLMRDVRRDLRSGVMTVQQRQEAQQLLHAADCAMRHGANEELSRLMDQIRRN
jgi:hypothetical protein